MREPKRIGRSTRLQSGIQKTMVQPGIPKTNGLLLKGVVTATYVTDEVLHPSFGDVKNSPIAVYCDVVVYPSIPRQRWFFLEKVLVSQKRGGLHDDDTWKPKATTANIVTEVLDNQLGSNPGQLDGDHVLIGFTNDSFDEPIILRGIPHPSRDVGNELYSTGKRLKLKQIDGNTDVSKFNGVFRGVDKDGNHIVDSTYGHNGELLEGGLEPLPDATGTSGNQNRKLPKDSSHEITFWDMTVPTTPVQVAQYKCSQDVFEILLTMLPCLKVEGSATTAKLTLGNGAVKAAVADHLETFWTSTVVPWLAAITVPTGTGPSGPPLNNPPPSWDPTINSGKLTFPDG